MEKTDILEDLHQKVSDCKKQKEYLDTCQEIKNSDLAYLSALDAVKSVTMSSIDEILLILQKDPEVSDVKFQILESNQILVQLQINNLLQELKFTNQNKNFRKQNAHEFLHTFGFQSNIEVNSSKEEKEENSQDSESLNKLAQTIIEKQKVLTNSEQDEDFIRNEKLQIQEEIQKEVKKEVLPKPKQKQKVQIKEEAQESINLQEEIF